MSRFGDRQRIKYEERLRQEAREDFERERYAGRQKHINKMMRNQRYVDENGREGAFVLTLMKWTIAGAVFALIGIIGSIGEKSIWEMLKMVATSLIFFAGVGAWRAFTILQSTR